MCSFGQNVFILSIWSHFDLSVIVAALHQPQSPSAVIHSLQFVFETHKLPFIINFYD